jgi:Kef-type K+ transport system membrane component KefB/mannitol/fructose-specific phosphotransferase system IIA component (Ntr-type)
MLPLTDPILVFSVLVLIMLIGPLLARWLHIPDLVLLLGFGALLGPNGLHVLERGPALALLGAVGLLYIMFLAGLEIDLSRFARSYRRSILFGLLTFLIPLVFGTLAGRYILGMSWPASLLLASMFASHTLLAYPLASKLGITRSEPVTITVGATILTDTLALLVLAIIADAARGMTLGPVFWTVIAGGLLALTALTWWGIPWATRWFFQRFTEESNAQFLFVIGTVCICAYLSHFARMEPIIGAFLAGAAFNRLIPASSSLMQRVNFAGHTLFIPFFLISVGMLVDVQAMLAGSHSLMVGATMVVMVVITKYGAAQLVRRYCGYSPAAGNVMFGLSVVQAAATLAAVVVGYDLKIFDEAVLNGAIIMILVTCPLGSWMVDRYGRRMAVEEPVPEKHGEGGQRLMVAVANAQYANRLLDLAFLLRNRGRTGEIYPLTIVRDQGDADAALAGGERLLAHCVSHAAAADIPVTPGLRVAMNISDGLVHAARELRSSMVVLGWSEKQTASIRIFGTITNHLVQNCPPQLLFSRLVGPLNITRRLLVPFPELSRRRRNLSELVHDAKVLAHGIGAELRVYTVRHESDTLLSLIKEIKPTCRVSSAEADSWRNIQDVFLSEIAKDDMILLPLDRRNSILWTPALDRLPELIVERFPEANMLVSYPSLPSVEGMTDGAEVSVHDVDFPRLLPVDLGPDKPLEGAVQFLAGEAFPDRPELARAAASHLLTSAHSSPVELAPEIVLVHARFGNLDKPLLLVGHSSSGWTFSNLPVPARVVLVLLGGQTQAPEQHLRTLSKVAVRMHETVRDQDLWSVPNAAALCDRLAHGGKPAE